MCHGVMVASIDQIPALLPHYHCCCAWYVYGTTCTLLAARAVAPAKQIRDLPVGAERCRPTRSNVPFAASNRHRVCDRQRSVSSAVRW